MSKTTEHVLLVPGETSWEIWTCKDESGFQPHDTAETKLASELEKIPNGDLTLFFPVKSLTAVPMRVASDDESLFPDLAAMQAERLGIRSDPMAGQLSDVFVVDRGEDTTALLSVFLRSPGDGDLPPRGPKGFDISPRGFKIEGSPLVLWKEFGRWVFALYHEGSLVFCQATSEDGADPAESLAREIRLSLMQLEMQGLNYEPSEIIVWTSAPALNLDALRNTFTVQPKTAPRPTPALPDPLSSLLPADVRAARRDALRRRNITLGAAAVALIYLMALGWFSYDLWNTSAETKRLVQKAEQVAPEGAAYAQHIAMWDELAPAIELAQSPLDILYRVSTCIPPRSGLRLKTADISASQIKLIGEAPELQAVNSFSLRLTKHNDLATFVWQTPEPNQSKRGWEFVFSGEVPVSATQP